jgi:hypothetical protein
MTLHDIQNSKLLTNAIPFTIMPSISYLAQMTNHTILMLPQKMVMLPLLKEIQTISVKGNPRFTQPPLEHLKQFVDGTTKMEIPTLKKLFEGSHKGVLINVR